MDEDYKSVLSEREEQIEKIAELIKENNDLVIENNINNYSLKIFFIFVIILKCSK